ncbi:MAG: chloride channel protein, partial [Gemmatimonadota bacterium]|nr:chloride channel protein [Gemmatimonadota bacterium]
PVAGVMFAVEVILTSFAARSLGLVVIAAMTATAFTQAALGRQPAFELTQTFVLVNEAEFALYILLGVITGTLATLYIQLVYGFERIFDEWSARPWLKALTGGLVVGAMGLFGSEHLFGVGHEGVELALNGDLLLSTMVLLVFLKMVATSVTLGAGGSGGVFAPALFVGAMAGGAFGVAVHGLYPTWTAPPGAYALVGMAALFGGAAHAPVTAMVILFEMTDNYEIVLPLMLTVVISYLMASRIFPDSIYSLKLRRRGALQPLRESSLLDVLMVNDAMSDAFDTVSPATTIGELSALARSKRTRSWPVVGADGRLQGIVTETDLLARDASGRSDATVGEIMTPTVVTCRSRDPLSTAMRRFAEMDVQLIPVVDDADPRIVHGVLRRSEMRWVAHTLADEHRRLLDEREEGLGGIATGMVQVSFTVPPSGSDIAFRKLNEVGTPSDTLIVLVRRGGRSFVPVGRTRIEPGDELLFLTTDEKEPELREWLGPDAITGNPAPADGTPSPRSH